MSSSDLPVVITIDGPSGAGKGTISRAVASKLNWNYLDSGAIYRALGLALTKRNISPENTAEVVAIAGALDLVFSNQRDRAILLDGVDISLALQTEECGAMASVIAAVPEVRAALLNRQRDFRLQPGLVADGRDMGTVVFPDAQFKIFLTASVEARAERRYQQLKEQGVSVSLDKIKKDLLSRDERDRNRSTAPLTKADGALEIDSSNKTIDKVLLEVFDFIGVMGVAKHP